MHTRTKKVVLIVISCLLAALLAYVGVGFWQSTQFRCVTYHMTGTNAPSMRVVLLSDVHDAALSNEEIAHKVADAAPDFVCLCGDFLSASNLTRVTDLIERLCACAEVFFSLGNSDITYWSAEAEVAVTAAGAIILNNDYVTRTIDGVSVRFGGLYAYASQVDDDQVAWESSDAYHFLTSFTDTDDYTILLCHRPESFFYGAADDWAIDLLLCGHTHGGVIRIPPFGGVIASEQRLFPQYVYGRYALTDDMTMIITAGVAAYHNIPRFYNPAEIALVVF